MDNVQKYVYLLHIIICCHGTMHLNNDSNRRESLGVRGI